MKMIIFMMAILTTIPPIAALRQGVPFAAVCAIGLLSLFGAILIAEIEERTYATWFILGAGAIVGVVIGMSIGD